MSKHIFLDLEGTVCSLIENQQYSTTDFANLCRVREWMLKEDPNVATAGIFSYAIDNKEEKDTFMRSWLRKGLEERLGVMITRIVTAEEAQSFSELRRKTRFEFLWEFKQRIGKETGFIDYCKSNFKDCECVLLDDMVDNVRLEVLDKNLIVRCVNVNQAGF